jgi:ADP-ribosyl-[dinitrogen reductase] hydrolase
MFTHKDALYHAFWGFIIGDAMGVPYEFTGREEIEELSPDVIKGGGVHNQLPGTWSDDSSMMLCVLHNLSEGGNSKSLSDKFLNWYLHGEYSPHGEVFDIGNTTRVALEQLITGIHFHTTGDVQSAAGNGALMRCIPYAFKENYQEGTFLMALDNRITHPNALSTYCCYYYTRLIRSLAEGHDKMKSLAYAKGTLQHGWRISNDAPNPYRNDFERLFAERFAAIPEHEIQSTGYVLHTLEAAVWCFMNSNSYEQCVLKAINLGEDTDTIAALSGALAAVYYKSIPEELKAQVVKHEWLDRKFQEWVLI